MSCVIFITHSDIQIISGVIWLLNIKHFFWLLEGISSNNVLLEEKYVHWRALNCIKNTFYFNSTLTSILHTSLVLWCFFQSFGDRMNELNQLLCGKQWMDILITIGPLLVITLKEAWTKSTKSARSSKQQQTDGWQDKSSGPKHQNDGEHGWKEVT